MHGVITCALLFLLLTVNGYAATITVPENSPSIQAAIENAEEGDTVYVRIGRWHEHLVMKDNVALIGESMRETIVFGNKKRPVITAANESTIKNLTVTRGRTGILCENVSAVIDQVYVTDNRETGIHCLVSLPDIYNCVIYRNRGNGILCESTRSIKTAILHNVIAENGNCGIMLSGVSEVLIQNNVLLENKQYAVWGVETARRTRIVYNLFFNNRNAVNVYLKKDPSNITVDPGYPRVSGRYDFFSPSSIVLKGRGKDGATIGLIGGEVLTQKLTDPDEDGVLVEKDKCPSIPEDIDGFEDNDGCPEFDNDKDGIFDTQDACPDVPEDYDGFRDEDGCADTDNDKDGIPDSVDICKENPETANGYKDEDGCPDEVPPDYAPARSGSAPVSPAAAAPEPAENPSTVKETSGIQQPAPSSDRKSAPAATAPADTAR